jgi:hypothetical protein
MVRRSGDEDWFGKGASGEARLHRNGDLCERRWELSR